MATPLAVANDCSATPEAVDVASSELDNLLIKMKPRSVKMLVSYSGRICVPLKENIPRFCFNEVASTGAGSGAQKCEEDEKSKNCV